MTLAGVSQTRTGGGKTGGGGAPTGPCGGDLSGTFPNCSVIKVDGVAYPASPSTNTIPVVTGANTVTYELVPLASLATQAADTVDMNATGGVASPTAVPMPTCTSGADLYNTTTHSWSCVTTGGAPSGAAGGDLNGTYPNPGVVKINGTAFAGVSGDVVSFGASNIPADSGVVAANLAVAVSPGAGVAHFAGSTQTLTSSTIATADIAANAVTLAKLATQAADTVLMNATVGSAAPTAVTMPAACTTGVNYSTSTHTWTCPTPSSLPTGTTGQGVYYAAGGTTGTATSATTTTSASAGFPYGVGMAPITDLDVAGTQSQIAPYTGTVTLGSSLSATATSATLSGGNNLNPNGGYVLVSYQNVGSNQEILCYSAATSTTMTIGGGNCGTPVTTQGRSYFGTTAAIHNSGDQIVQLLWVDAASISSIPRAMRMGNGGNGDWAFGLLNPNTLGHSTGEMFGNTAYFVSATGTAWCLTQNPTAAGGDCAVFANGSYEWTNGSNNAGLVTAPASLDYAIATQGITGNGTLTAITNAKTPTMPNNNTAAAAGTGGVLTSHCTVIWNQATSGTVAFGIKASAAPTDIWVKEQDSPGAYLAPVFTTITSTTTTATSGTITPTAFGTTYASDLWIAMNPGTTNSVSFQLFASASANTLTIEPGTGCTALQ